MREEGRKGGRRGVREEEGEGYYEAEKTPHEDGLATARKTISDS